MFSFWLSSIYFFFACFALLQMIIRSFSFCRFFVFAFYLYFHFSLKLNGPPMGAFYTILRRWDKILCVYICVRVCVWFLSLYFKQLRNVPGVALWRLHNIKFSALFFLFFIMDRGKKMKNRTRSMNYRKKSKEN